MNYLNQLIIGSSYLKLFLTSNKTGSCYLKRFLSVAANNGRQITQLPVWKKASRWRSWRRCGCTRRTSSAAGRRSGARTSPTTSGWRRRTSRGPWNEQSQGLPRTASPDCCHEWDILSSVCSVATVGIQLTVLYSQRGKWWAALVWSACLTVQWWNHLNDDHQIIGWTLTREI